MTRGNIVGDGFSTFVREQVEARQKVFGATNRTSQQLQYLNSRDPFIKLSSAVDIEPIAISKLAGTGIDNLNLTGNALAKEFVLFGGTATNSGKNLRAGLYNAYNVGGDFTQGYRPMPGITSANIKYRNRGSVRETTVNIKAYNKTQFNIIDLLYLRLGYTVLLEWGHTVYINNNGDVKNITEADTLTSNFVSGGFKNQVEVQNAIKENKKKLFGNYDAIYGKVSNFSWNFEIDGSYTITLTILSLGDIIESLKINTIAKGAKNEAEATAEEKEEEQEEIDEAETDDEIIAAYKNKDAISKLFFNANKALEDFSQEYTGPNANTEINITTTILTLGLNNIFGDGSVQTRSVTGLTDEAAKALGFQSGGDYISLQEKDDASGDETKIYVRFGGFLEYIKNNGLIYNGNISYFDIDNDINTNLIFTTPYVLSADPRVCIVQADITVKNIGLIESTLQGESDTYHVFNSLPFGFKANIENTMVGALMNVYFSVPWILKSMDEIRDEKGDVLLYDFLNKLCEGINSSLGNVNKLSVAIDDEDNNRVYFLDEVKLPNRDNIITKIIPELDIKPTIFQIWGYKPNDSGFIRSMGIKTEITNELATMISISAQASTEDVKGIDATAFSKWNEGLKDRIIPVKSNQKDPAPSSSTPEQSTLSKVVDVILNPIDAVTDAVSAIQTATLTLVSNAVNSIDKALGGEDFESTVDEYESFCENMEEQQFEDNIDYMPTVLKNFLTLMQNQESKSTNTASPTVGFIPLNINLEMEGLSGMKIMQKFEINQNFLPYNYPQTIEFLIKSISHNIDQNGWITSIESLSQPKVISSGAYPAVPTSNNNFTSTDAGSGTAPAASSSGGTAPAVSKATGGKKKVKLGINNIPDTIDKCPNKLDGVLNEPIIKSTKVLNAYKGYIKGKKSFIEKVEKAYDVLLKQGIKLDIGDSYRDFGFQKTAYIQNEAVRSTGKKVPYKAHPCEGYHVQGQAIDLNQTQPQLNDITSHGKIYKALYDAGLRRIGNEWWHWSIGEATHGINQKFGTDKPNFNKY